MNVSTKAEDEQIRQRRRSSLFIGSVIIVVVLVVFASIVWIYHLKKSEPEVQTHSMRVDWPSMWEATPEAVINYNDQLLCYDTVCADEFKVAKYVANLTGNAIRIQKAVKQEVSDDELKEWRALAVANVCRITPPVQVDPSVFIAGAILWYGYDDVDKDDVNYWYEYQSTIKKECREVLY